ncbi:MAG: N-acetyltransferase [Actinomycetota bacterium]
MGIRLETSWDHPEVRRLVTAAFGRRAEAELVDKLRDTDGFIPQLSLVADQSGVVVGHIMFTHITLECDPPVKVLALAPVSVYPAFQNKGIGGALIKRGLTLADERGESLVVVLGHPEYYPRFGFVTASTMGIKPPWPVDPDEAFMAKPLSAYREDMKGTITYPPEFDEF